MNDVNVSSFITWSEFLSLYRPLVRYIVKRKDDTLMFFHPLFREWLIKRSHIDSNKFLCDPRIGHAFIALSMTRMGPLIESEQVLDICHHILQSNIYKDVPSMIPAAYLQSFWCHFVQMTAQQHLDQSAIFTAQISRYLSCCFYLELHQTT